MLESFWIDVKIHFERIRKRYRDNDRSRGDREIISQLAWAWTGLVIAIAITIHLVLVPELEGVIGELLTGTGTIITAIWIISTFKMQIIDLAEQRRELTKQRQSMQHQVLLENYKAHKSQLDNIARIIVYSVVDSSNIEKLNIMYSEQRDSDLFGRIICDNLFDTQNLILRRVDISDETVISNISRYLRRYDALKKTISNLDEDGMMRDTLLTDSQISDLYIALSSIKNIINSIEK